MAIKKEHKKVQDNMDYKFLKKEILIRNRIEKS